MTYEQKVTGNESTRAKKVSRYRWTWDGIMGSPLTQLAMTPVVTEVSCFKMTTGRNQIEMYTYTRWPGERERATVLGSMLSTDAFQEDVRRLILGSLVSEAARLITSFSS